MAARQSEEERPFTADTALTSATGVFNFFPPPPVDTPAVASPATGWVAEQSYSYKDELDGLHSYPPRMPDSAITRPAGTGWQEHYAAAGLRHRPITASTRASRSIGQFYDERQENAAGDAADKEEFPVEPPDEDSPYPEVQASVSNYDDPTLPALTFRVLTIGLLLVCTGVAANTFFALRYPAPYVTPVVIQLLAHPIGKAMANSLPITEWRTPRALRFLWVPDTVSLNPGPWNQKEHTVIVIMANCGITVLYVNLYHIANLLFGQELSAGYLMLLSLTTQAIAFALAGGLTRRFLVWPASMIWPTDLVTCAIMSALHAEDDSEHKGWSRYKMLTVVSIGSFAYAWLPGYLFQALSAFSWICWIAPENLIANQLGGVFTGLGMGMLSFDWSQITWIASPLIMPKWVLLNVIVAFVFMFWIVVPALYYSNVNYWAFFPIFDTTMYDRFGQPYDLDAVVNDDLTLNPTAYAAQGPIFMPIAFYIAYGVLIATPFSLITHTILYDGKRIWRSLWAFPEEEIDIHYRLMTVYPEVPASWYLFIGAGGLGVACLTVLVYDIDMPIWLLLMSFVLPAVWIVPCSIVTALSSIQPYINVLVQWVGSYMMDQSQTTPVAHMLFKLYGFAGIFHGIQYVQDLKLGHYMKVPPRVTFMAQIIAVVASATVQLGVRQWMVDTIPDLCSLDQKQLITCGASHNFKTSAVFWGLLGVREVFANQGTYGRFYWWPVAGAVAPLPVWLLARTFPNVKWLRKVNVSVMLTGLTMIPPGNGINYTSWFIVGAVFLAIRKRNYDWWARHTFTISAGLEFGTVVATLIIFLALQLPQKELHWWGNEVFTRTLDWTGNSYLVAPENGIDSPPADAP